MLLDVWALGEQMRSPESYITVSPGSSPRCPWATQVTAGLSQSDMGVITAEQDVLTSIWVQLAECFHTEHTVLHFADFFTAPRSFHAAREEILASDTQTVVTYAWPLGAGDHEGGTLPLGSVLQHDGAVREVDGVYVAGPATFPRAGAANPSLTTLALARMTAQAILIRGR